MTTLAKLNRADRAEFTASLGHVFEHSPWIAEETWARRPFRDAAHLHAQLCATMRAATLERKRALIRAHPDLAGRLHRPKNLTEESRREQTAAGLDALSETEAAELSRLNESYRAHFGFPFVICARLNTPEAILAAMRSRLQNAPEVEIETALGEIEKIARLRLAATIAGDSLVTMSAKLSTHVLDLTRGAPAAGMEIELWSCGAEPCRLKRVVTNADGRTDEPLLAGDALKSGDYQLVFKTGDYFARQGAASTFFVHAAVFFRIEDPAASYHVPLLVTPWAYSTYRGS